MRRLRLIHWNAAEASDGAGILRALGYRVDASPFSPAELRKLKTYPADAFLIDLSRLPSQGRDVALFIRQVKATRHIPLVLIEGDREKVAGVRRILPDAIYTMWSKIRGPLTRVLSRPPKAPVVPGDLTLWFVRSRRELEGQIRAMTSRAASAGLWILWPKRTSGMSTDLTQNVVRRVGLRAGLVDFKISAVDATWSGLRFTLRKAR